MQVVRKVTSLHVGDVIVDGKRHTTINSIEPCGTTLRRGVPKIHVNQTLCYDTIGTVIVEMCSGKSGRSKGEGSGYQRMV